MRRASRVQRGNAGPQNSRLMIVAVIVIAFISLCYVSSGTRTTVVRLRIPNHPTSSSNGSRGIAHPAAAGAAGANAAATAQTSTPSSIAGGSKTQQLQNPPAIAFQTPAAGAPTPTGKHFSQQGTHQDETIDKLLQGMTGGFFVESGAFDGVIFSNTLFLEATRNWTGLLVEANPLLHQKILQRSNRTSSRAINACLSPTGQHTQLDFILGDSIGGLSGYMSAAHKNRIYSEIASTPGGDPGPTNSGEKIKVECWSLAAMMAVLGKTRIDYWRWVRAHRRSS